MLGKNETYGGAQCGTANVPNRPAQDAGCANTAGLNPTPKATDRATTLPNDGAGRKTYPVASGVMDYFPDALVAVSNVSYRGNEQHNPGSPLHWDRSKSTDEADTMLRHFLQRGTRDTDGTRHSAKMVWRALAILQKEIEKDMAQEPKPFPVSTAELRRNAMATQGCENEAGPRNYDAPHTRKETLGEAERRLKTQSHEAYAKERAMLARDQRAADTACFEAEANLRGQGVLRPGESVILLVVDAPSSWDFVTGRERS